LERGRERWTFDERVLGSSQFVTQLLAEAQVVQMLRGASDGQTRLAELIRRVAERFKLTEAELCSGQRVVSLQMARAVVAYLAVRRAGLAVGQVAGALRVSRPTVWRAVRAGPSVLDHLGITADELLTPSGAGQAQA
jgi:chromosomal replication initiation ATPase DnaA